MTGNFLKYANGIVPYNDEEADSPSALITNFDLRHTDKEEQLTIPLLNSSGRVDQDTFTTAKM